MNYAVIASYEYSVFSCVSVCAGEGGGGHWRVWGVREREREGLERPEITNLQCQYGGQIHQLWNSLT